MSLKNNLEEGKKLQKAKEEKTIELLNEMVELKEEKEMEQKAFEMAKMLNDYGIAITDAIKIIQDETGIDKESADLVIKLTYEDDNHSLRFGSNLIAYHLQYLNKFNDEDWSLTPFIPDEVFNNLPNLLKTATEKFPNKRERDVFLTGIIPLLGGTMKNVYGVYKGRNVSPNLFSFIIAPPASGKGVLTFARKMAENLHQTLKKKKDLNQTMFIPANISSAAFYEQLNNNNGHGILFETEADSMKETVKQDWGNYSYLLRQAFHHEPATLQRKKEDSIEIDCPKISVILSGTRNQIRGIISNNADGLFSRFIFYTYRQDVEWKKNNNYSLDDFFRNLGGKVDSYFDKFSLIENFNFTKEQWMLFDTRMGNLLKQTNNIFQGDSISIISRMGLILFRIAMILTCLRHIESLNDSNTDPIPLLECNEVDFNTAFLLVYTYIPHSLYVYTCLNKDTSRVIENTMMQKLYEMLPENEEFERAKAVKIGETLNIKERTIDKYLSTLCKNGMLLSSRYGYYKKPTN